MISTLPSASEVAVTFPCGSVMSPVAAKVPVVGSWISAVGVRPA
jgi:hypothetical protein